MAGPVNSITLSLISHTNVGKTTLARTLLRRDVGEVRDAEHVTDVNEAFAMIETGEGDLLRLWDTPGFGDTGRLLKRLKMSKNPIGWFLTQVWDRFTDRAFWCNQMALKNVRNDADVVLYLVDARDKPEDSGDVEKEMEILSWLGKPLILLLNQTGEPRPVDVEKADEERWYGYLKGFSIVKAALSLDAFARCWVQEGLLLNMVREILPKDKKPLMGHFTEVWRDRNLAVFYRAVNCLSGQFAWAICDREMIEKSSWNEKARRLISAFSQTEKSEISSREKAMSDLAVRLDRNIKDLTDELIELHGLTGEASAVIQERFKDDFSTKEHMDEGFMALLGGVISGTIGGLMADLAAGGLTLGGGALGGGILGALGASGLAKGYNVSVGDEAPKMRWSLAFVEDLFQTTLLRYLAVAHFGRGRGDYEESEHPKNWLGLVQRTVDSRKGRIREIWELGEKVLEQPRIAQSVEPLLIDCLRELLERLYPDLSPFDR